MEGSKIGYQDWIIAIFQIMTSLKRVHRSAPGAAHAILPTLLDEPLFGGRVVGEQPEDLLEGNAFAE